MIARVIGIDIGTTSVKIGAYGERLEPVAHVRSEYGPAAGALELEQDPNAIWMAVRSALAELSRKTRLDEVRAIGIDGQGPTLVLTDAEAVPLTPSLSWRDARASSEADEISLALSSDWRFANLNASLPPGGSWPPARLLWYARHQPELVARARHALSIKDYVVYRLTGMAVTDPVNARGLVRAPTGETVPEMLSYVGARDLVPPAKVPWASAGLLRHTVAEELGLSKTAVVAVGWGDVYCAMLAAGVLDEVGRAFDIPGSAEGIGATGPDPVEVGGLVSMPVWPGRTVTYGSTQAGCGSVEWWRRAGTPDSPVGPDMIDRAAAQAPRTGGLIFLPHLSGERAPLWDTRIRGAFLGLELDSDWRALSLAVLEGVAFSVRQVLELTSTAVPNDGPVLLAGSAAQSQVWNQIKSDALGRSVVALREAEASSLGAAMLGAVAGGLFGSVMEASSSIARTYEEFEPDPSKRARYDDLYLIYRTAQRDLDEVHRMLHDARTRWSSSWPAGTPSAAGTSPR